MVNKHMDRFGLTRGTRWCQNHSPSLSSIKVIYKKLFPENRNFDICLFLVRTVLGWLPI